MIYRVLGHAGSKSSEQEGFCLLLVDTLSYGEQFCEASGKFAFAASAQTIHHELRNSLKTCIDYARPYPCFQAESPSYRRHSNVAVSAACGLGGDGNFGLRPTQIW